MSENFSYEGLDRIIGFVPRATGTLDTGGLWAAAITTAGTVDASVALTTSLVPNPLTVWSTDYATGAAGRGGGGEPVISTGGYTRCAIAAATWQTPTTISLSRRSTVNPAQSFPQSTAAWSNTGVIGNAIVTASGAGSGVAYYYSNFSDGSQVNVNATGIVLQITPYWEFGV